MVYEKFCEFCGGHKRHKILCLLGHKRHKINCPCIKLDGKRHYSPRKNIKRIYKNLTK